MAKPRPRPWRDLGIRGGIGRRGQLGVVDGGAPSGAFGVRPTLARRMGWRRAGNPDGRGAGLGVPSGTLRDDCRLSSDAAENIRGTSRLDGRGLRGRRWRGGSAAGADRRVGRVGSGGCVDVRHGRSNRGRRHGWRRPWPVGELPVAPRAKVTQKLRTKARMTKARITQRDRQGRDNVNQTIATAPDAGRSQSSVAVHEGARGTL